MSTLGRVLRPALLCSGALLVSVTLSAATRGFETDPVLELSRNALLLELWLAVAAVSAVLLAGRAPGRRLGLGPGRLGPGRTALLALGTLGASHALDGALDLSGLADESVLGQLPRVLEGARGGRLAAALLGLGVAPAIAEELLCRGWIQRGLDERFGPALAIPVSAAFFGALHVDPVHAAFAVVLGLYLGWVAHRAGSIRPAILCHGVNNLAAVGLAAAAGDVPWASGVSVGLGGALALGCLALARPGPAPQPGPGAAPSGSAPSAGPGLQPGRRSSDR